MSKTLKKTKTISKKAGIKKSLSAARPVTFPPKKLKPEDEAMVQAVLKRGRERGFITHNEILQIFPAIERKVEVLEELYRRLEDEDIDIIAQQELLELKVAEKEVKKKKKVNLEG